MIVGLLTALLSAVCYGVASVLQAVAARKQPVTDNIDPRLLTRLATQWQFLLGIVLDLVAFVSQFISLRSLEVFVVQAIQSSNLAVTAVVAIPLLGARLRGREWAAVAAVCFGLVLLGLSAGAEHQGAVAMSTKWGLLIGAVAVTGLGFLVGALPGRHGPMLLGFVAGLGFGVVALAARVITDLSIVSLLENPALYALGLGGLVSFLFYTTALQRGLVTTVTAAVVIGETLLPSIIGVWVLGDRPREGMTAFAFIGFAISVAGALMLARFGEPEAPDSELAGLAGREVDQQADRGAAGSR